MTELPARLTAALADRYRVERELGVGGMATVYLAADLKHDRKVAIKVLKPELAAVLGAERFVQEIKTTAAMSHPHILPLFDSGEADGFLFYVMPYIEGETIREKLNRETQFGIDEAVKIATEVADALEYAHQHGVIHRDIKPENILLHAGRPMVMDFGIALALSAAAGGRMTETGLSLGTPHYMSPEQATADKAITARSDVYSLASVLYEMLTGEPPHVGSSAQQIIMKIITDTPRPVTELRKSVPPNVAAALARALEKLPADRFESAKGFAEALTNQHFTTATALEAPGVSRRSIGAWLRSPLSRVAMLVLALSLATMVVLATRRETTLAPLPTMAFTLVDSLTGGSNFALADDGTIVRYRARQLFVRRPGDLTESPLAGTDEATPFRSVLSPDGSDVLFVVQAGTGAARRVALRRVSLRGGISNTLWTGPDASTFVIPLAWSADGWIFVTMGRAGGGASNFKVGRLPENGGAIETIWDGLMAEAALLPGDKALVGCAVKSPKFDVVAIDLRTRDTVLVVPDACSARWSPTGHLLVANPDGSLRALPFDPERLRVTGPSTPVLSGLATGNGTAPFELSRTGTLMYVAGPSTTRASGLSLALVGLDGSVAPLPLPPTDHWDAAFSPNGKTLAYTRDGQIWMYDLDLGTHRRFTRLGAEHHDPVFSPDGSRLAYRALRTEGKGGEVYVQALVGDTVGTHIGGSSAGDDPTQWLADGRILVYHDRGSGTDLATLNANQPGPPVPVLQADWSEERGKVSPDGKWLAYLSNEAGRNQLVVRAWPALDKKSVIADSVLFEHHYWSNDSRTLYYVSRNRLMAASLAGTDLMRTVTHRVAIDTLNARLSARHPDGRRFLVARDAGTQGVGGQSTRRSLIVVTGWLTALRQRLAAGTAP